MRSSPLRRKMTHHWSFRSSHTFLQLGSLLSMHDVIPVPSVIVCAECTRACIVEAFYCYRLQGG